MKPKVNPHLLAAGYVKAKIVRAPGGKLYLASFGNRWSRWQAKRKYFRTANGALAYSRKLLARWCRLYDAASGGDCHASLAMTQNAHASSVARTEGTGDPSQVQAPFEPESSHERQAETLAEFCEGSERPIC